MRTNPIFMSVLLRITQRFEVWVIVLAINLGLLKGTHPELCCEKRWCSEKCSPLNPWQVSNGTSPNLGTLPSSIALPQIPQVAGYYHPPWLHHWTLSSWVKGKIHVGSRWRWGSFLDSETVARKGMKEIDWVPGTVRFFHIHLPRNFAKVLINHS